jgi:hypothetical protein
VAEGDTLSPSTLGIEPITVLEREWVGNYLHINGEAKHARFVIVDIHPASIQDLQARILKF